MLERSNSEVCGVLGIIIAVYVSGVGVRLALSISAPAEGAVTTVGQRYSRGGAQAAGVAQGDEGG